MRLTDSTEVRPLANGRFVAVSEGIKPATILPLGSQDVFTCSWMIEAGYTEDGDAIIRDCGSLAVGFDNGFACANGHAHRNDVEYYTEEEARGTLAAGHALAPNARLV